MPPASKKDYGIIIFDLNTTKKQSLSKVLLKFSSYMFCLGSNSQYKLILCSSKRMMNAKKYPNIITTDIECLDPVQVLNCIENEEVEEGNWLDALLVSIHDIKEAIDVKGVITFQIMLYSTFENCNITTDEQKIQQIVDDLNNHNIFLYFIGPDVKLNGTISCDEDIPQLMKQLSVDETNPSLKAAKEIVQKTKTSLMCNMKMGFDLCLSYKLPRGTQPWKVPLGFGSQFTLPASTVKVYKKEVPLKLVQVNKKPTTGFVLIEDESVTVSKEDIIGGIIRHGKFVKIEDNSMFKIETVRGFDILGFTDRSTIPEILMRDEGTFYVLPSVEQGELLCQAFYYLVDVLYEQDKYAVVKRVYNKGNKPKFYVLIPRPELQPKCFVMSALPYADSLRAEFHYDVPASAAESESDEEFLKFFNSLDITRKESDLNVPITPNMCVDHLGGKLSELAVNKLLNKSFDFDDINGMLDVPNGSNEYAEKLQQSWVELESTN